MDSKIEKYYQYIVDDLVGMIKYDDRGKISLPFTIPFLGVKANKNVSKRYSINTPSLNSFLVKNYGTRKEDAIVVWSRFKDELLKKI
jgi:hypothetical protein